MKNNILTVMKKECSRIFGDKKLFLTAVILPGLLIFMMYSLMGNFMDGILMVEEDYVYQIHAVNMPTSISEIMRGDEFEIHETAESEIEDIKQQISERETDLLIIFPPNFDEVTETFDPTTATELAPNVQVWANFARNESSEANSRVTGLLNEYHHALTHRFRINAPTDDVPDGNYNLATDADMFAMFVGMMIPMLFIIFIYTGCQSLAPESIAGEKERGTLGSILVTPAKRRDIALGKILGIGVFALLSALVSIFGVILSLPAMMTAMDSGNFFDFYSIADFAVLILIAASTTLVFVSLLSVFSAYAKSVKEANAYSMPIMLVVIVAGLAGMISGGVPESPVFYFIPIVNSSLSLSAIFSYEINIVNILITAGINIALSLVFTVVLAKIFSSEKIVFDK